MTPRFEVLLPVKAPGRAKSRLALGPTTSRARVVRAFVLDTIAAVQASDLVSGVHVVSTRPADFGVPVIDDRGEGSLNRALAAAAGTLDGAPGIAVLLPDLPALRTEDLDAALAQCGPGRWFAADHAGSGTTLLAATGVTLDPRFGADSARHHRDSGADPVGGELRSLRLDVDTAEDLAAALALGVGKNTAAALPRWETPPQQGV